MSGKIKVSTFESKQPELTALSQKENIGFDMNDWLSEFFTDAAMQELTNMDAYDDNAGCILGGNITHYKWGAPQVELAVEYNLTNAGGKTLFKKPIESRRALSSGMSLPVAQTQLHRAMTDNMAQLIRSETFLDNGSYIHSDPKGVHANNIQRLLFKKKRDVCVLRSKKALCLKKLDYYARAQIGQQYSKKDVFQIGNKLAKKKRSNRQFCSRLVAEAYEFAGVSLVKDSSFCVPEEIYKSPVLECIDECVRIATLAEIAHAETPSLIELQDEATNKILSDTRNLTGQDIQDFDAIATYLVENPIHDAAISSIILQSGYLSIWEPEYQQNQWRYNEELFLNLDISSERKIKLAQDELSAAKSSLELHSYNYIQFQKLLLCRELTYAKIMLGLYRGLINRANERIEACQYVLDALTP